MAPFKADIFLRPGDKTALAQCSFTVPAVAFKKTGEADSTTRTGERIADYSSKLISTVVKATADVENNRPRKRQRRDSSPTEAGDDDTSITEDFAPVLDVENLSAKCGRLVLQLQHRRDKMILFAKRTTKMEKLLDLFLDKFSKIEECRLVYDDVMVDCGDTPQSVSSDM